MSSPPPTRTPRVNGQGLQQLQAAGIEVETGLLEAEALETLIGFNHRITLGRPMVTLKLASTLDGRIATQGGESQWITGTPARRLAHAMRGRHDAVMVGVGTVLADNPDLTCRIPGFRPTPNVRVIADSHLRTPLTSRLLTTAADIPTWFLLREGTNLAREDAFIDLGAKLIKIPGSTAGVDLKAAMTALRRRRADPGAGRRRRSARRRAAARGPGGPHRLVPCALRSWAATAGPRCRRSASRPLTRCRASGGIA